MNEKIKIIINQRVLDSIWNNDRILIIILLLIIKHSLGGQVKSVKLDFITYIFDLIQNDTKTDKNDVIISTPWDIANLRSKIISAHEMNLIIILKKDNNTKVAFKLTNLANDLLAALSKDNLISEMETDIIRLCNLVKNSDLQKQKLTW
jgi:hypothetical protein